MVDSVIFIGAIIIAITEAIKYVAPAVSGAITIMVAMLVGIGVALVGPHIGVAAISIAQGIMTALAAVGVHTVASKIGTQN